MIGTLQLLGLAATGFGLVGSLARTIAQSFVLRATEGWGSASRHRALRLLGALRAPTTAATSPSRRAPRPPAISQPSQPHRCPRPR